MKAFVGVFDVLGFKNRIDSTPLGELVAGYRRLVHLKRLAARVPVLEQGRSYVQRVNTTVFSDTILMWCRDSARELDGLLVASAALMASAIDEGWPLRGGVAYGDAVLTIRDRIFVGPAIVDAFLMEQSQKWVGAALHPSVLAHPKFGQSIRQHDCVTRYPVPTGWSKKRLSTDYAIHWGPFSTRGRRTLEKLAAPIKDVGVRRKYRSALRYLHTKCKGFAVLE